MSIFGKQHRYCPNCGQHLYDEKLSADHVLSMMCSAACLNEWELKYARMILRKDAPAEVKLEESENADERR